MKVVYVGINSHATDETENSLDFSYLTRLYVDFAIADYVTNSVRQSQQKVIHAQKESLINMM